MEFLIITGWLEILPDIKLLNSYKNKVSFARQSSASQNILMEALSH